MRQYFENGSRYVKLMTDKKLRALSIDIKIDDYWITWNCYKFQLFSLNFTDLGGNNIMVY